MKRIILMATMATLGISGVAFAVGSSWDGVGTKDEQAQVHFVKEAGKVRHFAAAQLKYGPQTDPDCTEPGRTDPYELKKALPIEGGEFHGHGHVNRLMRKGDGSVTMKVSGRFVSPEKAKGVVSLTDSDSKCTTKKTEWSAQQT